jgi:hypothetical protein
VTIGQNYLHPTCTDVFAHISRKQGPIIQREQVILVDNLKGLAASFVEAGNIVSNLVGQ